MKPKASSLKKKINKIDKPLAILTMKTKTEDKNCQY